MRLLFCLNGPNELNGPNVWLTRHLPLLQEQGFTIEILYLSWRPELPCRYRDFFAQLGYAVRNLKMEGFVENQAAAIVTVLSDDLPDVFVPNYSIPAYYAARFLRDAGVLTIGTLHSDDPYYHDIVDYFVSGPQCWRLSGVVGVSDFITDLMSIKCPQEVSYLHAPYGAPVPETAAQRDDGPLRMVYTGRIVELQKRIGRLTRRLLAAAEKWPDVEAVLYGSGVEEPLVAEILAKSVVGSRVRLAGALDQESMRKALLQGHVFVLLSDFEGLSISLMEAMACGLVPVISRMESGVADLIRHGENGFVIDADDPQAFLEVVGRLRSEPQLWQKLSSSARSTIVDKGYTPETCARKWSDFLHGLSCPTKLRRSRVPHPDQWEMPPGSAREDGLRYIENRSIRTQLLMSELNGRPLYLWGAGSVGVNYLQSINRAAFPVRGFIDSDPKKQGSKVCGLPIYPLDVLDRDEDGKKPFIIVASSYGKEIAAVLEEKGFRRQADYF